MKKRIRASEKQPFPELCSVMIAGVRIYLAAVLVFIGSHSFAQYMDTLRTAFASKKSLDFGFDSRNTFADNERMEIQSVKLGVEFGNKIALGTGYAWLNSRTPVYDVYRFRDGTTGRDTNVTRRLTFGYVRFYVNYIYYRNRRWEFSIPLQVGVGSLGYKYRYGTREVRMQEGYCFLYEPEVDVKFKALRWLGIEGDIGYRFLLKNNSFIKHTFNSPLISVGVFIVWNELALMALPDNEWVQKNLGPGEW